MKTTTIIAGLLALSGFAGCDNTIADDNRSPHADYEIEGRVVNEAGEGVPDILVTAGVDSPTLYFPLDGVMTDATGNYRIEGRWMLMSRCFVIAKDIDGAENGGEYAEGEQEFDLELSDFTGGDGRWYEGRMAKTVNFTLTLRPQGSENE